jgi:predicted ATP-dependent serine protease
MNTKIFKTAKDLGIDPLEFEGTVKSLAETEKITIDEALKKMVGKDIPIIKMSEAAEKQDKSEKIPCGMNSLDEAMGGGLSVGSSVVIAAPSGEGKTAFMVSMSYHFLVQAIPCLWFSFEENIADIWERFKLTGISDDVLAFCPLELENNRLNFIEEMVRKFKKENEFFVVFIDQLSFLAPKVQDGTDIDKVQGNYAMYLGLISQQIKNMAMEQKVVIIFAHQLGRTGDVAYSDMIKHSPDKVIYLKREPADDKSSEEFTNKSFVVFKKNRPLGTRPRLAMTVKNSLFVPLQENLTEYAEKSLGWKKVDNLFDE